MKRILIILFCFALLLAGCKTDEPAATTMPTTEPATVPATQAPTTEPTVEETTAPTETEPPVPDTLSAAALADRTYVVLMTMDLGAAIEIVDTYDEDFYVVSTAEGYGLIEKRLVRMDGEEEYEGWTGYAVYQAKVYDNYHLLPGNEKSLNMNTKIQVLAAVGETLVVQMEDGIAYMRAKEVSRNYIQPTPSSGNSGSADGGDIILGGTSGVVELSCFVSQSGTVTGKGTVLAEDAEIILGWFDRDEAVAIINEEGFLDEKEGWYGIYHEGFYGYVRQELIRKDTEEPYTEWDGFAKYQAQLFDNYYLYGEPASKLATNANVHVIADLGNCYLVICEGYTGYIAKDMVSQTRNNYSNGGGNGGDSGGDWTPPAL